MAADCLPKYSHRCGDPTACPQEKASWVKLCTFRRPCNEEPPWNSATVTRSVAPLPTVRPSLLIPLIVGCALFMENMDATVLATSLPALARDLHQDPITLKLAMTAYVAALGVFIPISGWMADKLGARKVFSWAMIVFMTGSILCAVSGSLVTFVAARFLQGIGGAMMVPVGRVIIARSVDKSELVKAVSYLTLPALLGPVVGPLLGGFLTTYSAISNNNVDLTVFSGNIKGYILVVYCCNAVQDCIFDKGLENQRR